MNSVEDVEYLAKQLGYDVKKMLHTIAFGQGQHKFANYKLDFGQREGLWVMLQNVHLISCLPTCKRLRRSFSVSLKKDPTKT